MATKRRKTRKRKASTVATYKPRTKAVKRRRSTSKRGLMANVKAPLSAIAYGAGGGAVYALGSNYLTGLSKIAKGAIGFGSAFLVSYMFNPLAGTGIAGACASDLTRGFFGLSEDSMNDNEYIDASDLNEGEIFINDNNEAFMLSEAGDLEFVGMADELELSELEESSGYGYN